LPVAFPAILAIAATGCGPGVGSNTPTPALGPTSTASTPIAAEASAPVGAPASPAPTATLPPGSSEVRLVEPTATATPAAFRSDSAELGSIVWATAIDPQSKAPTAIVTGFADEVRVIYATTPITHLAAGTELGASWSYNNTPLDGFVAMIIAERDQSNAWAEFHIALTGSEPWPPGTYRIEITVDGQPALASEVTVSAIDGT
jgi:hypothetical protein